MEEPIKTETGASVSEKKEQYMKENYAKLKEALIQIRDPKSSSTQRINAYTREVIRSYIQSPASSETQLRNAAQYFYYRSQVLYRLVNWYAGMWALECRKVTPDYSLTKENNDDKILKSYQNTINALEIYDLQNNFKEIAINCYLYDVCYSIFYRDKGGAFFYILDPSVCKLIGRYSTGDLAYAVDMSKFNNAQKRQQVEWLGEPLTDMLAEYERTGEKWVEMPAKYAAAFKFRIDDLDHIIPPFSPLLQSLAGLSDTEDVQAILDDQAVYRLLAVPIPTLSGAKTADDWAISPDMIIEYYKKMAEILPEYVAAIPMPGELTTNNVIDFSTTAADKDIDRLSTSQDTIFSISGGGAVLNSSKITSTAAFNAWLKAESAFAISTLIGQIQGFTNRMLSYDVSGTACKVKFFEVTIYTKQELAENLLKACQYSFSDRLAYNACIGISEKETLAMEYFEVNVLKLPELMNHPLVSSFTQSGDPSAEAGRPPTPDDELTDSGERSRNA